MAKQHDKQFKLDAIQYYQDHKDLGVRGCAENLDIGPNSTLMFYKKIISRNRNLLWVGTNRLWKEESNSYW